VKKPNLFRLKNQMLVHNVFANLIGISIYFLLSRRSLAPPGKIFEHLPLPIVILFEVSLWSLGIMATIRYEQPIRRFLNINYRDKSLQDRIEVKARQRLLNEPFFLITIDLLMWFTAAVFYPLTIWASGAGHMIIAHTFFQELLIGLLTATAAFFLLEHVLQKKLVPVFYPSGGLSMTPNTLRIRIRTRLFALITACNLIPFLAVLIILAGTYRLSLDPAQILDLSRSTIFSNALVFMWIGISLTFIVSSNLTRPIGDITSVLKRVRDGYLDRKVRVTSNDEIGYTGDVINEMTEGLKERERMRQSLELAMEVQRSLLPQANPMTKGFDIAGVSIYCDETGGDYFDYLDTCENEQGETAVVVGDVSGHGIPSALLMATARAFLRLRSSLPGSMSTIIADVNRQLTQDVEGSGQFMTLFYLVLDSATRKLRWIRAGHDPAILYNPATDTFDELKGDGMVLGINEDWVFQENERVGLETGQILFLGTDGIWEAHNAQGDMFGKDAVRNIIRKYANASAQEIQEAIVSSLKSFRGDVDPEDDVTMVVIKVLEDV